MVTMSESTRPVAATEHRIVVPVGVSMVGLLGTADEFLRVIEGAFPGTEIHARGNEITVVGLSGEVALVERLVDELVIPEALRRRHRDNT
jgi:phosphate starvation-inducible PhoH-like protein